MHADEIRQATIDVVDSGWYLQGSRIDKFEQEYAQYIHTKHCITTANGLDALTLMIRGYKELGLLNDGDEVIVPANTYIATILSITENNLTPVLVEPSISNFQIDENLIEKSLTQKTRAIMLVHLYGYDAYTAKIGNICKQHNLLLFEDFAQAHGLPQASLPLYDEGVRGACAHSFYPGKNMGALADAGAVTTMDDELAETVKALANYGSQKKYVFKYKGRNSRMDEMSAAILSVKLKHLDADNRIRQHIADRYIAEITNEKVMLPPSTGVHHVFPILTSNRDELQTYLKQNGIQTVIHYPIPPHRQECYKEWNRLSFPVTEQIHREELSLPMNQAITDKEASYIIETINNY